MDWGVIGLGLGWVGLRLNRIGAEVDYGLKLGWGRHRGG